MSNIDKTINSLIEDECKFKQHKAKHLETLCDNNEEANANANANADINTKFDNAVQYITKKSNTKTKNYQLIAEKSNQYYQQKYCDTAKSRRHSDCANVNSNVAVGGRINCAYELTLTNNGKQYIHRRIKQQQQQQQQHQHPHHHHQQPKQQHQEHEQQILKHHKPQIQFGNRINDNQINNTEQNVTKTRFYIGCVIKLLISTPGLVVIVVLYSIMGAFIFPLFEAPIDVNRSALIAKSREECLKELWIITEKLNVLYERNWTMLVHEQLKRFEGTIVAATRKNVITTSPVNKGLESVYHGRSVDDGSDKTDIDGRHDLIINRDSLSSNVFSHLPFSTSDNIDYTSRWTFSEGLLYSVTVITTIGQGSLTPRTVGGKIATILYALIGVPLMLMCLSSLGALLADLLQYTYIRLCCPSTQRQFNANNSKNNKGTAGACECDGSATIVKVLPQKQAECKHHQNCMSTGTIPIQNHYANDNDELLINQKYYNSQNRPQLQNIKNGLICNCNKYVMFKDAQNSSNEYVGMEEYDDNNCISRDWCNPWPNVKPIHRNCQEYSQTIKTPSDVTGMATQSLNDKQQHKEQQQKQHDIMLITNSGYKLSTQYATMPLQKLNDCNNYYDDSNTNHLINAGLDSNTETINNVIPASSQSYFNHLSTTATYRIVANDMSNTNIPSIPGHISTHIKQQQAQPFQQQQFCNTNATSKNLSDATQKQESVLKSTDVIRVPNDQCNLLCVPIITTTSNDGNRYQNSNNISTNNDSQLPKSSSIRCETMQLPDNISEDAPLYATCKTTGKATFVHQQIANCPSQEDGKAVREEILPPPPPAYQATSSPTRAVTVPTTTSLLHGNMRYATYLTDTIPSGSHTLLCDKSVHDGSISTEFKGITNSLLKSSLNHINTEASMLKVSTDSKIINKNNDSTDNVKIAKNSLSHNKNNNSTLFNIKATNSNDLISSEYPVWMASSSSSTPTISTTRTIPTTAATATATAVVAVATTETKEMSTEKLKTFDLVANDYRTSTGIPNGTDICTTTTVPATYNNNNNINTCMYACICENRESECLEKLVSPTYINSAIQLNNCDPRLITPIRCPPGIASTFILDIIDNDDNDDCISDVQLKQQHNSNCPHGTPSRIPLLPMSTDNLNASSQYANINCDDMETSADKSEFNKKHVRQYFRPSLTIFHRCHSNILTQNQQQCRHQQQQQRQQQQQLKRSTASNIQQTILRKSLIINHKGKCSLETPTSITSASPSQVLLPLPLPLPQSLPLPLPLSLLPPPPPPPPPPPHLPPHRKAISNLCYANLKQHHCNNIPNTSDNDKTLTNVPEILETDTHIGITDYDNYVLDNNSISSIQSDYITLDYAQIPITLVLLILIFYICMGTVLFALWENWSFIDGAYFCFVTLTTIGYGDFLPIRTFHGPQVQLFACCAYLLVGLVLVAMTFTVLESQFIWKCKRLAIRLKLVKA